MGSKDYKNKDRIIAAALTFGVVLILLLILFFGSVSWERQEIAKASTPELMEPEELFIEPELVELGEEKAVNHDKPAPAIKGEPDPAPEDHTEIKEPAPKPKPKPKPEPPKPTMITQKKESKMKVEEPKQTDKERQKATSSVANKFSKKNGAVEGTDKGSAGSGGTGIGISGNAHGRTFISCPKPDVALRHKTVVKVNVVVDAEGNVTEASATGSADVSIRRKCEAAARAAKWSPKKGATSTRGSITFTITPR